jgi:NTE family protein
MATAESYGRSGGAPPGEDLALVLTGGGAHAAYQVGLLSWLARRYPELRVPIITGVSAGAVNAAHLAAHHGSFEQAVRELRGLWGELTTEEVFHASTLALGRSTLRWGLRLISGGGATAPRVQGLVDTSPLRRHLEETLAAVDGELTGIDYNLHRGALRAAAISTTSFSTGESVVWVQGADITTWQRPFRRCVRTRLTVDHVMASAALPILFPAVRIDGAWYGDGGVRLAAPLSPALHLGANRIIAVSTRSAARDEAGGKDLTDYLPPAQILGVLFNAVFLDLIDQDAQRLERINQLLHLLPEDQRDGMRLMDLLVVRPSVDLGQLATEYEPRLPAAFRFLTRGLGTRETRDSDLLSMIMFEPDYLRRLIRLGEEDAEARAEEIAGFLGEAEPAVATG